MKPVLFLDVDGVINCLTADREDYDLIGQLPCMINLNSVANLQKIVPHFDVLWCTAWFRQAAHPSFPALPREDMLAPLEKFTDLGPFEELPWKTTHVGSFKLPAIKDFVEADGRPWVWIDDDAQWELEKSGIERGSWLDRGLIVNPDSAVGVTAIDVDRILDFVRHHNW